MSNARKTALDALVRVEKDGAYSNLALDQRLQDDSLSPRDAALASALFYGVLERSLSLDYALGLYLRRPIGKLKPEVRMLLRMGAYQLLYMDKIPASAAVNETVSLAKQKQKTAYAAGLVNGVLRSLQREGADWPDQKKEPLRYLETAYSCPPWLVRLLLEAYGEENTAAFLQANFGRPPLTVRVNPLRATVEEAIALLAQENVQAERTPCAFALSLTNTGSVEHLHSYQQGLFHVQDLASQYCCEALDPKPGQTVLDVCSAPGGKAFTAAQMMKNRGRVTALDLSPSRVSLIQSGAQRLGLTMIDTFVNDASVFRDDFPQYDRVLCDVPCSGLGILRRKPEIRQKSKEVIDKLPDLQYLIMGTSVKYVKPNGRFVYSTCTVNPEENEKLVLRFLHEHPDFRAVPVLPELPRWGENTPWITLFPHLHGTDGFFIAALERVKVI